MKKIQSKKRKQSGRKADQNLNEIYRHLRTNIEFSQMDKEMRVINVVSTQPNEGKSSVSLNLAKIFADKYSKVLLIDCDLRNASLHRMLRVSNDEGLSNLLTHYQPDEDIATQKEIKSVKVDNNTFNFLSAGFKVPNPAELLGSRRFGNFIKSARKQYSTVIIDCPPCLAVSDAVPISNVSDGTLFVFSAKDTDKNDARDVLHDLERNGANMIGTVMTKVPDMNTKRYGYYGYGEDHE